MAAKKTVRTIADIADLAGVSKSTVSRALNDSSLISPETRARIQAIAQANNFAIHQGARNLSLQRTHTIAVVIPISPEIGRFVTDPFNLELLGAVANATAAHNYDLLVAQVQRGKSYQSLNRYFAAKKADGLILFACDLEPETIDILVARNAPFVVWGLTPPGNSYPTVGSDDVTGGRLAVEHLLSLGRRQIGFIGGPPGREETEARFKGYQTALTAAGVAIDETLHTQGDYTSRSGYEAMQQLLAAAPQVDAVFVNSDVMAFGVLEALREVGRQVPQDVAVVGYDGVPISAHSSPPLTTVRQNIAEGGRLLVENLLQYLDDGVVTNVTMPVELVVRQSTMG